MRDLEPEQRQPWVGFCGASEGCTMPFRPHWLMAPPPANVKICTGSQWSLTLALAFWSMLPTLSATHCGSVLRLAPSWANRLHNPTCPVSKGFQALLVGNRLKRVQRSIEGIQTGEQLHRLSFSLMVLCYHFVFLLLKGKQMGMIDCAGKGGRMEGRILELITQGKLTWLKLSHTSWWLHELIPAVFLATEKRKSGLPESFLESFVSLMKTDLVHFHSSSRRNNGAWK